MDYFISHFNDKKYTFVKITGVVERPDDSVRMQRLSVHLEKEYDCHRFLFDMTQAEIISTEKSAIHVGLVPADVQQIQKNQKVATMYAGDLTQHQIMVDVANGQGYNIAIFNTRKEALLWLLAD